MRNLDRRTQYPDRSIHKGTVKKRKAPEGGHGKEKDMTKEMNWTINLIKGAYIKVYGAEKWESLNDQEKHDVIMILANNLMKAAENL